MATRFDRESLRQALALLGEELAARGAFVELAVYGGGALMLQFAWRESTEDLDAVVREGSDERLLAPAVQAVATRLGLEPDWLNDAVGMFTPLEEDEALFSLSGTYPEGDRPGLRVLLATPRYLLAMKLAALASFERGDRDLADARALAGHLGLADEAELSDLYRSVYGEPPPERSSRRFANVLEPR